MIDPTACRKPLKVGTWEAAAGVQGEHSRQWFDPHWGRSLRSRDTGGDHKVNRGGTPGSDVFRFDPLTLPPECERLRADVRAFIADEKAAGRWRAEGDFASGHSPDFSR